MKTYLRIISLARPFRRHFPYYALFSLLAILFGLLNLTLLKPLLDVIFGQMEAEKLAEYVSLPEFALNTQYFLHLFNHYMLEFINEYSRFGALAYVCCIIVISVFLANLFRYIADVIMANVRADVVKRLRITIFDKVSRLHLGYFSNQRKGDIMSRITNDVQQVEVSVAFSLKVAFREPATIIIYFLVLFSISTELTLFSLIIIPILGGMISEIARRLRKKAVKSQESLSRIVGILDETLSGMRIIKAFTAREYILDKFEQEATRYRRINVSMARKNDLASPLSQFLGVSLICGILLYGGYMVINKSSALEASTFIMYLIIFSQILPSAKEISKAISNIQRGLVAGDRVFKIVDTVPEIKDEPDAKEIPGFKDQITFKDVSFAYEKEVVLNNVNLNIKKGKTIALVGPSGGGKSTIADLIPRFYDPTHGEVQIDGHSIKEYKIKSIRNLMGIVTQESILFNDTIYNNISFGSPHANQEEVTRAAKVANAHDFIMQTEDGYQTYIGERGSKLSGGERQRLTIARAVLKNPPILILDEATSALDSESEKLVQKAIANLMENRTAIVIAHRLSTIQHADEILVVQNGNIIEKGTHDSLIANQGLYKKLMQTA